MATLEERVAHIEKFLNNDYRFAFEPIPDPKYVTVVIDEALERSVHAKQYTYEDGTGGQLKVGYRVWVPVGNYGASKLATVVRVCAPKPPVHVRTKVITSANID